MSYYSFRTNWHKHPWVTRVLCWFDRHDYELDEVTGPNSATLSCFYCEKRKHSTVHKD